MPFCPSPICKGIFDLKQTILLHFRFLDCDAKLGSVSAYYLPIYPIVPLRNPDIYSHLQFLGALSYWTSNLGTSLYIFTKPLAWLCAWHALPNLLGPDCVPHQVNLHFKLMEFDPITAVLAGTQNIQLCRLNCFTELICVHIMFFQ